MAIQTLSHLELFQMSQVRNKHKNMVRWDLLCGLMSKILQKKLVVFLGVGKETDEMNPQFPMTTISRVRDR